MDAPNKIFWSKVIRVGAIFSALLILVSAGNGVYSFIVEITKKNEHDLIDKTNFEIKVDSILKYREAEKIQMVEMKNTLNILLTNQKIYADQTKVLNRGLSDHLQASKTTNEYIKWLELQLELDKK